MITQNDTDEILDVINIDNFEDALKLENTKPEMVKYLNKKMKYYLYTVECRRNNKFAMASQSWEIENGL